MNRSTSPASGFTLVEAVIVIAVTGIVAAIVAIFIVSPVKGYATSTLHAQMTDAADATLRRMQRDIRLALPNSLRVTDGVNVGFCGSSAATCYIEYIPTTAGAMYRALGDGSVSGSILSFTDNTQTTFDVLGLLSPAPAVGDYVVVYNLGPNFNPSNAYLYGNAQCATAGQGCNIAKISGGVGTGSISLSSNPFANEGPPLPSPNNRFQIVPNAGPVTYTCSPSTGAAVNRYSGYSGSGGSAWSLNQPTSFSVSPAVVLDNATCDVDYSQNALARSGLLFIRINVTDAASGDVVTVFREIHVDNSP
jgi:MSHA biogenesis protein MshO